MLVVGDREMEARTITPRSRKGENMDAMTVEEFVGFVKKQVKQEQEEV
jgi:threonyl-tRNA synthetase